MACQVLCCKLRSNHMISKLCSGNFASWILILLIPLLVVVVQLLSCIRFFATPWTAACQPPCPSLSPRICSNSSPLSQQCYLIISFSATPFSFCLQSFPVPGSFLMSWLVTSGDQIIQLQHQSFQ